MVLPLRTFVWLMLLSMGSAGAEQHTVLDGIQVGQSLSQLKAKFGEPAKIEKFGDGWVAYVFKERDHYLVLQTDPQSPDEIANIQITGSHNETLHGLDGINLGDDLAATVAKLGRPDRIEQATDAVDKKPVARTSIYIYGNSSFESADGKLTSLKLERPRSVRSTTFPDLDHFLALLRSGDLYRISEALSPTLTINDRPAFNGPVLDALQSDPILREALFGRNGMASMDTRNMDAALRLFEPGSERGGVNSGYVFKPKRGPFGDLVFVESSSGWVLYAAY